MIRPGPPPIGIAVLGASGLIGSALAHDLCARGYAVTALARSRPPGAAPFPWVLGPLVSLTAGDLAQTLGRTGAGVVVNCVGVLQDGPSGSANDVHAGFAARLAEAVAHLDPPPLLVHVSVPGDGAGDPTAFSRSKRAGEAAIVSAGIDHAILRPGFVLAPAAYGGSALLRALGAFGLDLPTREAGARFDAVAVEDIAETVAVLSAERAAGARGQRLDWDLVHPVGGTVGSVLAAFRTQMRGTPRPILRLPGWTMAFGTLAGDVAGRLGWRPPIRSTALAEMRRGVSGDPAAWMAATGIRPRSLNDTLAGRPRSVQDRWFARLYLLKAAVLATLSLFWIVSGLVPLLFAFQPARAILAEAGVPFAGALTVATSLLDIAIGAAIAVRRSAKAGLLAGTLTTVLYLAAASVLTPALWLDPVGALVKTVPALVLMLVALAILDDR